MCARSNSRDIKMWETNRSHTRFQVKEDDDDSLETCFPGEIVLPKRRIRYEALRKFLSLKWLLKGPLSSQGLTNLIR
ncbi:hypothetical protein TNCV_933251 [Trichonephila clavipes]|nr:hypothetical protein TNCV_933251 [Trichonephila clavipes]